MTTLKRLFLATGLAGSIALGASAQANAQDITLQDLIIPSLLVASGILIYDEVANGGDGDDYRRDWSRDDRRYAPYPNNARRVWVAPPPIRYAPPPPPRYRYVPPPRGRTVVNVAPWNYGFNQGKKLGWNQAPGYKEGHRSKHR